MQQNKKILFLTIALILCVALFGAAVTIIYKNDKNKYEPKLWIGFFDYRLNFRDVGASLNQCLNKDVFNTGLVFRANKYFSGWSCDKINNPKKIYSLNYNPDSPHAYYCYENDGSHLKGFHPNTTFEIKDIEILTNWEKPEFKETMCTFFKESLVDLSNKNSFLFHCDAGRDRTGTFAAMLTAMLAEQKNLVNENMLNAIECDYEKTRSLESEKKGRMKNFIANIEKQGGVSVFLKKECGISDSLIHEAAHQFIAK